MNLTFMSTTRARDRIIFLDVWACLKFQFRWFWQWIRLFKSDSLHNLLGHFFESHLDVVAVFSRTLY